MSTVNETKKILEQDVVALEAILSWSKESVLRTFNVPKDEAVKNCVANIKKNIKLL